jgi:hypothetical protein
MKQAAVLLKDGELVRQSDFARHIRHIPGGKELYRADVEEGDTVLLLYISGSGKTTTAEELTGQGRSWYSWDEAEQALGLDEGALDAAFFGYDPNKPLGKW